MLTSNQTKEICYGYISISFHLELNNSVCWTRNKGKIRKSQKGAILFCCRERQKQKPQNTQRARRARFYFAGAKGKSKNRKIRKKPEGRDFILLARKAKAKYAKSQKGAIFCWHERIFHVHELPSTQVA